MIKKFEGLKLTAYKCAAGVWTIGYGHTMGVKQGDMITEARAEEYLKIDLRSFEATVETALPSANQNQFDALVSFAFNLGSRALLTSTLLQKIKSKAPEQEIRAEFAKWVNAGGRQLPGLVARRSEEANLFFA